MACVTSSKNLGHCIVFTEYVGDSLYIGCLSFAFGCVLDHLRLSATFCGTKGWVDVGAHRVRNSSNQKVLGKWVC